MTYELQQSQGRNWLAFVVCFHISFLDFGPFSALLCPISIGFQSAALPIPRRCPHYLWADSEIVHDAGRET